MEQYSRRVSNIVLYAVAITQLIISFTCIFASIHTVAGNWTALRKPVQGVYILVFDYVTFICSTTLGIYLIGLTKKDIRGAKSWCLMQILLILLCGMGEMINGTVTNFDVGMRSITKLVYLVSAVLAIVIVSRFAMMSPSISLLDEIEMEEDNPPSYEEICKETDDPHLFLKICLNENPSPPSSTFYI